MFSLVSGIYQTYFAPPTLNILIVGAAGAGKTTVLERCKVTQFTTSGHKGGNASSTTGNNSSNKNLPHSSSQLQPLFLRDSMTVESAPTSGNAGPASSVEGTATRLGVGAMSMTTAGTSVVSAVTSTHHVKRHTKRHTETLTQRNKGGNNASSAMLSGGGDDDVMRDKHRRKKSWLCPAPTAQNGGDGTMYTKRFSNTSNGGRPIPGSARRKSNNLRGSMESADLQDVDLFDDDDDDDYISSEDDNDFDIDLSEGNSKNKDYDNFSNNGNGDAVVSSRISASSGGTDGTSTYTSATAARRRIEERIQQQEQEQQQRGRGHVAAVAAAAVANQAGHGGGARHNRIKNSDPNVTMSGGGMTTTSSPFLPKEPQQYDLKHNATMLPLVRIRPTIGMNLAKNLKICGANCNFMDLGGRLTNLWERYYNDCHAVIFVWKMTAFDDPASSDKDDDDDSDDGRPPITAKLQLQLLEQVRSAIPDDVPFLILGHLFDPSSNHDSSTSSTITTRNRQQQYKSNPTSAAMATMMNKIEMDCLYSTSALLPHYHNNCQGMYFANAATGQGIRSAIEWIVPLAARYEQQLLRAYYNYGKA